MSSSKGVSSRKGGVFGRKKYDGRKGDTNEPGRCYRCGSTDHIMKDCTDTVGLHFELDLNLPQLYKGMDTAKISHDDDRKHEVAAKSHKDMLRMQRKAVKNRKKTENFLSSLKDGFDLRKFGSHGVASMIVDDNILKPRGKPSSRSIVPTLDLSKTKQNVSIPSIREKKSQRYKVGAIATHRGYRTRWNAMMKDGENTQRMLPFINPSAQPEKKESIESPNTPRSRFFRGRKGGMIPNLDAESGDGLFFSPKPSHEIPSVPPDVFSALIGEEGPRTKSLSGPIYPVSSKGLSKDRRWNIGEAKDKMMGVENEGGPINNRDIPDGRTAKTIIRSKEEKNRYQAYEFISSGEVSDRLTSRSNRKQYESESDSD